MIKLWSGNLFALQNNDHLDHIIALYMLKHLIKIPSNDTHGRKHKTNNVRTGSANTNKCEN